MRCNEVAVPSDGTPLGNCGRRALWAGVYGNDRIVHFDRDGKFVKEWGKLGSAPGEFSIPHSIVRDSAGLYAGDIMGRRIQKFVKTSPL